VPPGGKGPEGEVDRIFNPKAFWFVEFPAENPPDGGYPEGCVVSGVMDGGIVGTEVLECCDSPDGPRFIAWVTGASPCVGI
jgi:hypothetical protein